MRPVPTSPSATDHESDIVLALIVATLAALSVLGIAIFVVEIAELILYFSPGEHWPSL